MIIEKSLKQNMKPSQISKELRIPVQFIYKTLEKFKKDSKHVLKEENNQVKTRLLKSENPLLIEAIMTLLDRDGIYGVKLK